MRLILAGASGLIGSALARSCESAGDTVIRLVRRSAADSSEVEWHPDRGVDPALVSGVDAVVCLSGAGVGDHRWTPAYRRTILTSRVDPVDALARAIAGSADPPRTFVAASAVGYYGEAGAQLLDESAPSGSSFLATVCREWEAAAQPAVATGTRVVHLRTGIVLARRGPVLARMLPLFRLGLGGRLGRGDQYWSWISLADHVAATRLLISADDISGPVNLTAPTPVTNSRFTAALARLVHRPAVLPVPAFALRLALGGFAEEIVGSQRVVPAKLAAAGFEFEHPEIEDALRAELTD